MAADPAELDPSQTRLTWTGSPSLDVAGYAIYARQDGEPLLVRLGTTTGTSFDTGHPWAHRPEVVAHEYAVAARLGDGTEGFLSAVARNDDRDHDGLSDFREADFGTLIDNPDSDGDGLLDGLEIAIGTDPLSTDSDGDGHSDFEEVEAGSSPIDAGSKPAPPIAPVPRTPSGLFLSGAPGFSWDAVSVASEYQLAIDRADGAPVARQWYAAAIACPAGPCSVPSPVLWGNGSYRWSVQAKNFAGAGAFGASLAFEVAAPAPGVPAINLSAPNGGEVWAPNETRTVRWSGASLDPAGRVYVFFNDGTTLYQLADFAPGDGSWEWTVPATYTSRASFFVGNWVGSAWEVTDASDTTFSIVPSPTRNLLWHHQQSGDLYTWFLNGTNVTTGSYLNPSRFADTRWQIRGLADFDRDGQADVLWHHQGTGDLYVWLINGTKASSGSYLNPKSFSDTRWQIRGVADFNNDGQPDLLWHHQVTGDLYVWLMNGTSVASGSYLTPKSFSDTNWKVVPR